jgi:hypothetical protein
MSTSKFRPSSKRNPCPVCSDFTGKCRDNGDAILCRPLGDTRVGEVVGQYKCIANKGSGWATFKLDNSAEWTEEKRREWEAQKRYREQEKAREEDERRRRSLWAEERNRGYRALLSQLDLHPDDRADLLRRGFTEQEIEAHGFKSVNANHRLVSPLSPSLPGVKADGWHLAVSGDGYLCSIPAENGFIIGMQIRLRSPIDGNRYRWLSSNNAVLPLPNGENPIGLHLPPSGKPEGIALVEGVGAKPRLAAKLLNLAVIGAAGGQFQQSPQQLKNYLSTFTCKTVTIFPDAGDIQNQQVINRWKTVKNILNQWGYQVRFAWWGQTTKAENDIDEGVDPSQIEYLSWHQFAAIASQNCPQFGQNCYSSKVNPRLETIAVEQASTQSKVNLEARLNFNCFGDDNPEFEEKIRVIQRKLRSLSYPADIKISSRYLPDDLASQLPKSGLIGIGGGKNIGKSVSLKKIIRLAKQSGIPTLSITPRIALGREQAIKWEITWIDDYGTMQTRGEDTAKQISDLTEKRQRLQRQLNELKQTQLNLLDANQLNKIEIQKQDLEAEIEATSEQIENVNMASIYTLGLCWDSLRRVENRDLKNSLIIIDEAELGFTHLATSSTCRGNRPHLLTVFSEKVIECLMSGGRVILSDADLTDVSIDYVRQLLPIPIQPFIVLNDYKGKESRWVIDFRTGSRGSTLGDIMKAIEAGNYIAITTDSQAEAEALERRILTEYPELCSLFDEKAGQITDKAKAGIPCIVRLDSKTAESEAGKDFLRKPNEAILKWKPRILIYTPTMGVGVSIDETTTRLLDELEIPIPYFDMVFGLFFGVIEPSQCRQQLARIRANVPRIVWCKEANRALEGCKSFFPQEISKQSFKYHQNNLNPIDIARAAADKAAGSDDANDEMVMEELIKLYENSWDKKSKCWRNPHLDLYAKLKARRNYGLWNLAALLKEELEDEGHTVVCSIGGSSEWIKKIKTDKGEIKLEEAIQISQSTPLPTVDDARKVLNSVTSTKEDRNAARKTLLIEELPEIELTPEFLYEAILKDRCRWLSQQKLFWYYTNPQAAKTIDTDRLLSQFKKFIGNTTYMADVRTFSPKIEAIQKAGIFELVDLSNPDKIYTGDSDQAQQFLLRALAAKDLLKTAFDINVTQNSPPIALANRILGKMGLKLTKKTKAKEDNRYQLSTDCINNPNRVAVLGALDRKWAEKAAQDVSQAVSEMKYAIAGKCVDYAQGIRSDLNQTKQRWNNQGVKFKSLVWQQLGENEQRIWKILTDEKPDLMALDIEDCTEWMRDAIAQNDPELAQAVDLTLRETAKVYPDAFRKGVWERLQDWERQTWKALIGWGKKVVESCQPSPEWGEGYV